ncbi:MAG: hydroxymethylbilane synthase [candidate division Zixibacteria bacterium]|nr:hydroxymethylbilane synthase [candidate division Zixibacteria bacterium]
MREIIIGSRGSELALKQVNIIREYISNNLEISSTVKVIETGGDRDQQSPFIEMEGIAFFTKEIEEALLRNEIDIAVHSLKDMTTTLPEGLTIAAVGFREDRRELLLLNASAHEESAPLFLKSGSVIGTSSARRRSQIKHIDPSLKLKDVRGNVPTRIQKLRDGAYDALIIAAAGVNRLDVDLSGLGVYRLRQESFLPAAGQGVLAIESRKSDTELNEALAEINDDIVSAEVQLERGLLKKFNSGCSLPLGVISSIGDNGEYRLQAVLDVEPDGDGSHELRRIDLYGTDPQEIVEEAYRSLTAVKVS